MHSIQMKYGDRWAEKHGSVTGCSQYACKNYTKILEGAFSHERIESVEMILGQTKFVSDVFFIHKLTVTTNNGKWIACGGENPHSRKTYEKFDGYRLQYISGRYGSIVDMLQFHWTES